MAKQWFALTVALGMSLGAVGLAHAGDDKTTKDASSEITYPQSGDDSTDQPVDDTTMPADSTLPAEELSTDSPLDRENQSGTTGMESSIHSLKGEQAKQLQMKLQEKGFYQGKVDGQIGPKTIQALKDFQKEQGLQASGSLDAQTKTALGITGGSDVQPVKGTEGESDTGVMPEPGVGNDTNTGSGTDTGTGTGSGSDTGSDTGTGTDMEKTPQSGADAGATDSGAMDTGAGVDAQAGTEGTDTGASTDTGAGTDTNTGSATGAASGSAHGSGDIQPQAGASMSGDHAMHIKSAQAKLKAQGYFTGSADGADNEEFKNALRKFQRAKGLPESGSLDDKTASALGITMGSDVQPQSGTEEKSGKTNIEDTESYKSTDGIDTNETGGTTSDPMTPPDDSTEGSAPETP